MTFKSFMMPLFLVSTSLTASVVLMDDAFAQKGQYYAPVSQWSILDVVDEAAPEKSYCIAAQQFDPDAIFTMARNQSGEVSVALDFEDVQFDSVSSVTVDLDPGAGQQRQFDLFPSSDNAFVVRLRKDYDFVDALKETGFLRTMFDGRNYNFDLSGIDKAQGLLNDCLVALQDIEEETVARAEVPEANAAITYVPLDVEERTAFEAQKEALEQQQAAQYEKERELEVQAALLQEQKGVLEEQKNALEARTSDVVNANAQAEEVAEQRDALADEKAALDLERAVLERERAEIDELKVALENQNLDMETQIIALNEEKRSLQGQASILEEERLALRAEKGSKAEKESVLKPVLDVAAAVVSAPVSASVSAPVDIVVSNLPTSGDIGVRNDIEAVDLERSLLASLAMTDEDVSFEAPQEVVQLENIEVSTGKEESVYDVSSEDMPEEDLVVSARGQQNDPVVDEPVPSSRYSIANVVNRLDPRKKSSESAALDAPVIEDFSVEDMSVSTVNSAPQQSRVSSDTRTYADVRRGLWNGEVVSSVAPVPEIPEVSFVAEELEVVEELDAAQELDVTEDFDVTEKLDVAEVAVFEDEVARTDVAPAVPDFEAPIYFRPSFSIGRLLEDADVVSAGNIVFVEKASNQAQVAYQWSVDDVFGSSEQRVLDAPDMFDEYAKVYLEKTQSRCQGDFAVVPDQSIDVDGGRVDSYDVACIGDGVEATASVIFFDQDGTFTALAHEASVQDMDSAMAFKERIFSIIGGA